MITKESQAYLLSQAPIDFKADLLRGLRNVYNEPREPYGLLHVSDMTGCLRQTCFQKVTGRREFSDTTLNFFISGEIMDGKIKALATASDDQETRHKISRCLGPHYAVKEQFIWNGLVARPDVVHRPTRTVIEIKTARTSSVRDKPKDHQLDQLKSYMAILNSDHGIMFYIIMTEFENPFVQHYVNWIDEREKFEVLNRLEGQKAHLEYAIEKKDPSLVPANGAYDLKFMMTGKDGKSIGRSWLCRSCEFRQQCDKMRADNGEFSDKVKTALFQKNAPVSEQS